MFRFGTVTLKSSKQNLKLFHKRFLLQKSTELKNKRKAENVVNEFEVKDPNLIFTEVMRKLSQQVGGRENLIFPKVK